MGNTQSSEHRPASLPGSPAPSDTNRQARRQQSAQGLSSRAANVPPTSSLISTSSSASTTTQSSRTHAHATVTQSPAGSSHTRARSITAPSLQSRDDAASSRGSPSVSDTHSRAASRSSTLPIPAIGTSSTSPDSRSTHSPSSRPVDVPGSQAGLAHVDSEELDVSELDSAYNPAPSFIRPPRLPLPIEEEVHTPGSPIISPQDISAPLDEREDGAIPRRSSVLSSTTADDEELGDIDLFTDDQSLAPTVPTLIQWKGSGEKVFVTGTFVSWERKFKLLRDKTTGIFSATLPLKPGTHHVKFLVDDDMVTSPDLPTTVDFTNILVNYVEVVAPLPVDEEEQAGTTVVVPTEPMPIPGTAITEGQADAIDEATTKAIPIRSPAATAQPSSADVTPVATTAHSLREPIDIPSSSHRTRPPSPQETHTEEQPPIQPAKQYLPRSQYTAKIPPFLLDLDNYATPQDERFQRASRVTNTLPHPPSLPLFLAKSILNGATPHKDDASVLIMPNHTVLNHLATSSIRSGVLATSGTTRYKRKFLTTIMYRPTSDTG